MSNEIKIICIDGINYSVADEEARNIIKQLQTGNGGGTIYVESYDNKDLYTALTKAIADNNDYTVYDCTYFTGDIEFPNTITITKPLTIQFGNCCISSKGKNFFDIKSNNVAILGYNRATDRTNAEISNGTCLKLTESSITNESNTGFHIYSKGNKNLRFEYLTLQGYIDEAVNLWSNVYNRQCYNEQYPICSSGGIYIEKQNPSRTFGGNTCNNVIINQLLIDTTKHHGIYIDTPILSTISNTRLSHCIGHAIFINSGTSISFNNVYAASCNLAGFCVYQSSYVSLLNCVAEQCSIGFLIRSVNNISLFNPGCETTKALSTNPWSDSYKVTKVYGFNMKTIGYDTNDLEEEIVIKDISSDLKDSFVGTPIVVSGGRSINIYSPYSTNLVEKGSATLNTCLLRIVGNARKVYVSNIMCNSSNVAFAMTNDIRVEELSGYAPSEVEIIYDVTNPTILASYSKYITNSSNTIAPVYVSSSAKNVLIHSGANFYTNVNAQSVYFDELSTYDNFIKITNDGIDMINEEVIGTTYVQEIIVSNNSIGTNSGNDGTSTNYHSTEMATYMRGDKFILNVDKPEGYTTRLFIYEYSEQFIQYISLGKCTQDNIQSAIDDNMQANQKFRLDFYTEGSANIEFKIEHTKANGFVSEDTISIKKDGTITCKKINSQTIDSLLERISALEQKIESLS